MSADERMATKQVPPSASPVRTNSDDRLLYVIHAAADYALAAFLKYEIEQRTIWRVFVASKAGEIPAGDDWLNEIHQNLSKAEAFLLLLTPRSIPRHWIWYESGAAWRAGKDRLPVVAGMLPEDLGYPLRALQALKLEQPDDARVLFARLGAPSTRRRRSVIECGRLPHTHLRRFRVNDAARCAPHSDNSVCRRSACCVGCWQLGR
jgi:hypothetical protein